PTRFNKHVNKHPVKSTNTTQTPACQARECCNSCISDQTCFEWYFNPINSVCAFVTSNPCSGATYSISCIGLEGGSVRCNDG
ncbi:33094_t:CDS:2, partial [Racocetra persica]